MSSGLSRVNWRDTGRCGKFFWVLEGDVFPFFFFLAAHFRQWVLILVLVIVVVFSVMAKFGYHRAVLIRRLRHLLAGRRRSARPWWYRNRFTTDLF